MDEFEILTNFRAEYKIPYENARRITDNITILIKIYNNVRLFNRVYRSGCIIYTDLSRALFSLDKYDKKSILIQFEDLDIYGIFTEDQYVNFLSNVRDDVEDRANVESLEEITKIFFT